MKKRGRGRPKGSKNKPKLDVNLTGKSVKTTRKLQVVEKRPYTKRVFTFHYKRSIGSSVFTSDPDLHTFTTPATNEAHAKKLLDAHEQQLGRTVTKVLVVRKGE